jgi:hypothetical protein
MDECSLSTERLVATTWREFVESEVRDRRRTSGSEGVSRLRQLPPSWSREE